jgi:hypothetical protein
MVFFEQKIHCCLSAHHRCFSLLCGFSERIMAGTGLHANPGDLNSMNKLQLCHWSIIHPNEEIRAGESGKCIFQHLNLKYQANQSEVLQSRTTNHFSLMP